MDDAPAVFRAKQSGFLPDILGLDWIELRHGFARGRFDVGKQHLAPNGICMRRASSLWPIPHAVMAAWCRCRRGPLVLPRSS